MIMTTMLTRPMATAIDQMLDAAIPTGGLMSRRCSVPPGAPGGTLHRLDINPPVGIAASSIWSIAVAIGLVSMVVMIIVLARGGDLASSSLPTGYVPMSPLARLAAANLARGDIGT